MEELQNKFEELIGCSDLNMIFTTDDPIEQQQELDNETKFLAKECTKLCLESQLEILKKLTENTVWIQSISFSDINKIVMEIQQQINKLNETV